MSTLKTLFCAAAIVGATAAAHAAPFDRFDRHDRHDRLDRHERSLSVDQRQAQHEARIREGLAKGTLTRQEARQLRETQREIKRLEAAARSDGRITPREYARLDTMLDAAGLAIYRQNHDRQVARRY